MQEIELANYLLAVAAKVAEAAPAEAAGAGAGAPPAAGGEQGAPLCGRDRQGRLRWLT